MVLADSGSARDCNAQAALRRLPSLWAIFTGSGEAKDHGWHA